MREIAFDTETTGLDVAVDRIVEIGCAEMINHIPSGRTFQAYVNPERAVTIESFRVHGISDEVLKDKPVFAGVIDAFLEFIGDAPLIAHNADFDVAFMNAEFGRIGRRGLEAARIIDSLALARRRHPAGPNSLDALCNRYGIDLSRRTVHGALLDAGLLAEVYVELIGGRQATLSFGEVERRAFYVPGGIIRSSPQRPVPWATPVGGRELAAHAAFMAEFERGGLWAAYRPPPELVAVS